MNLMRKKVESIINVYDQRVTWAMLAPDYKGYELSNTGLVRSLKFPNKYAFGYIVEPDKNGLYELSNSLNKRVSVSMEDLINVVKKNNIGYNIPTCYINKNSRNPILSSKSDYMKNRFKNKNEQTDTLHQMVETKFSIIDE